MAAYTPDAIGPAATRDPAQAAATAAANIAQYRKVWDHQKVPYRDFAFPGNTAHREKLLNALRALGHHPQLVERLDNCATQCWVFRHKTTGEIRTRLNMCGLRVCPLCRATHARQSAYAIQQAVAHRQGKIRFITLTLPQVPGEPLADNLARFRRTWDLFRRYPAWANAVKGGVRVIETTRSKTYANTWHVHAHLIAEAHWLELPNVLAAWQASGGGSIHVQLIRNPQATIPYITKYLTKPYSAEVLNDPDKLAEYLDAVRGTRLLEFFGTWRNTDTSRACRRRLNKRDDPALVQTRADEWECLGELNTLIDLAQRNWAFAQDALDRIGFGRVPVIPTLPFQTRGPPTEETLWTHSASSRPQPPPTTLPTPIAA